MDCIVHGVAESDTTRRLSLTHSLVAQLVKSLSSMRETWVLSLGWEDPLEKGMATHSNPCPENPHGQRNLAGYKSMGLQRVGHDLWTKHSTACAKLG